MTQGTRTPARHSQRRSGSPRQPRREPGRASQAAPTLRLERLVHERVRLGILSALAVTDTLSFTDMKTLLATTDGNVSVHARKLEKAGYIACTKSFADRVPRTEYRLTDAGRRALEHYLDRMEALIRSTRRRSFTWLRCDAETPRTYAI